MPDGKWWSADDYRYDGCEWISPPNNYHWDATLAAARLYRRSTLTMPPGAHLPTSAEWTAMGAATGTLPDSKPLRSAQGWDALRAGPDTYGFGMIGANGSPIPLGWGSTGYSAKLLTSDGIVATSGGDGLSVSYSTVDYYASVRFIVDVFNEPAPSPYDFQPPPGTYTSPQSVSLNKPGFVYTTDGFDPTDDSKPFISPIRISGPTEIKVKRLQSPEIFTFPYIVKGKPMEQYKQQASMRAGAASIEFITRTQTL